MWLTTRQLQDWTGRRSNKLILRQLQAWGYREKRDYWIREDGTLAVRDVISTTKIEPPPAEPDWSSFGQTQAKKQTPTGKRVRPAWAVSAKTY